MLVGVALAIAASVSHADIGAWKACTSKYSTGERWDQAWLVIGALTIDPFIFASVGDSSERRRRQIATECDPLLTPAEKTQRFEEAVEHMESMKQFRRGKLSN